jgi:hypothetical protein
MGRYWQMRRAGSQGPPAAVGVSTLLANLNLFQNDAGDVLIANWTQVAPADTTFLLSFQIFDVDSWQEIGTVVGTVGDELAFSDLIPVATERWRVVASADGFVTVTSAEWIAI